MNTVTPPIAYIGPRGAGLGFSFAGIVVEETDDPKHALDLVRMWKIKAAFNIIFMDEVLAEPNLILIRSFNEDALPAIVLLPNLRHPTHTAAHNLQGLMVKAIGSDIFVSSLTSLAL